VLASGDNSYNAFLGRMRDWFKNECVIWPLGPVTSSTMPMVKDTWSPSADTWSSLHNWDMIEALSYSAVIHADMSDLETAFLLFEGSTRFWQQPPNTNLWNAYAPSTFSPITMRPSQFPSTESKALGVILNSGTPYLAVISFVLGYW